MLTECFSRVGTVGDSTFQRHPSRPVFRPQLFSHRHAPRPLLPLTLGDLLSCAERQNVAGVMTHVFRSSASRSLVLLGPCRRVVSKPRPYGEVTCGRGFCCFVAGGLTERGGDWPSQGPPIPGDAHNSPVSSPSTRMPTHLDTSSPPPLLGGLLYPKPLAPALITPGPSGVQLGTVPAPQRPGRHPNQPALSLLTTLHLCLPSATAVTRLFTSPPAPSASRCSPEPAALCGVLCHFSLPDLWALS